mgnify:CR=1 FL=1
MNEKISWDQSLVKKYGSSNHFKMLNQLRNEVKKYPLNKKKNISTNVIKDNKSFINNSKTQKESTIHNINHNNDKFTNQSTVSFNNSKDFSIYNNTDKFSHQRFENITTDDKNSNVDTNSTTTFKDRLNQIDMK